VLSANASGPRLLREETERSSRTWLFFREEPTRELEIVYQFQLTEPKLSYRPVPEVWFQTFPRSVTITSHAPVSDPRWRGPQTPKKKIERARGMLRLVAQVRAPPGFWALDLGEHRPRFPSFRTYPSMIFGRREGKVILNTFSGGCSLAAFPLTVRFWHRQYVTCEAPPPLPAPLDIRPPIPPTISTSSAWIASSWPATL